MTSDKATDTHHRPHRHHHDRKRARRPPINYPNPGPYKSRTCASRSSKPVTPWTNPRRSPYCSRTHAEDESAYEPNTLHEQLEAERRQEEEGVKEDWLEDGIPPVVRQKERFGKFARPSPPCLLCLRSVARLGRNLALGRLSVSRLMKVLWIGKFWINPHATNPTIRDPHYYRFPEGLPRCGFWNCTWKHDSKKHTSDEDFGYQGGHRRFYYDEEDNRPFKRRKANQSWDEMPAEDVGVLAYDDEPYIAEVGKDTS